MRPAEMRERRILQAQILVCGINKKHGEKMKNAALFSTALIAALFLFSCKPAPGPMGRTGPAGSDAVEGLQVMVFQNNLFPTAAYAGCDDTRIWQGTAADTNYGAYSYIQAGYSSSGHKRGLIRFDISGLPLDAVVKKAVLTLYCSGVVSGSPSFSFHRVILHDWTENEATWNRCVSGVSWTAAGGDYEADSASGFESPVTSGYTAWNIKPSLVQSWVVPSQNFGLTMIVKDTSTVNESIFASSESADVARRPKLVVYYEIQ